MARQYRVAWVLLECSWCRMWMMADNAKEALEQWQMSGASKVYLLILLYILQALTVISDCSCRCLTPVCLGDWKSIRPTKDAASPAWKLFSLVHCGLISRRQAHWVKTEGNSGGLVDGSLLIRRVSVVQRKFKPFWAVIVKPCDSYMYLCFWWQEYCFEPCLSVSRITQKFMVDFHNSW